MSLPRVLLVLALLALALGLGAGFMPLTAQDQRCGSSFIPSGDDPVEPFLGNGISTVSRCEFIRKFLRVPALVALVVGFGLLIGWGLTRNRGRREPWPQGRPPYHGP
ncbi:hypothetical protein [Nonomuraea sp. LPB2021202275-12-8]|uniref:hypothetical protein n=1 Tax=Nonomuraea sp. LPB2021202275-12-8 TaxID=3120159 RepID=UPI00300D1CE0